MDIEKLREQFAANVKTRRLQLGLTQTALAKEIGVFAPYISSIEAGRMAVTFDTLVKLANGLETTPDRLLAQDSFAEVTLV